MSPVISNTLLIFSLLTCALAFARGGAAERIGAAVILANLVFSMANELLGRNQLLLVTIDGVSALFLLTVAVRYASIWLGGVMLLYGLQFALHAYYIVLERQRDSLHVVLNNIDCFAVSLCLAGGTAVAWSRKRQLKIIPPALGAAP